MCRQYSAETEAALRELAKHDLYPNPDQRRVENLEWLALKTLVDDPFELLVVRKAIYFYLYHDAEKREEEFLDANPDIKAAKETIQALFRTDQGTDKT